MPRDGPYCPCGVWAQATAAQSDTTAHRSTTRIDACSLSKWAKLNSTLKSTSLEAEPIYETVSRNLASGMKKYGVRRLVWLDAAAVGSSKEFVQRSSFFFGRIIMPLFLNHMYDDAALADAIIEKSGCEWVIARPMSFTNGPRTGNLSVVTDMSITVRLHLRISRADVAAFLGAAVLSGH
jgi:hypothetical protein